MFLFLQFFFFSNLLNLRHFSGGPAYSHLVDLFFASPFCFFLPHGCDVLWADFQRQLGSGGGDFCHVNSLIPVIDSRSFRDGWFRQVALIFRLGAAGIKPPCGCQGKERQQGQGLPHVSQNLTSVSSLLLLFLSLLLCLLPLLLLYPWTGKSKAHLCQADWIKLWMSKTWIYIWTSSSGGSSGVVAEETSWDTDSPRLSWPEVLVSTMGICC